MGIWGPNGKVPKAIFYLLKRDYTSIIFTFVILTDITVPLPCLVLRTTILTMLFYYYGVYAGKVLLGNFEIQAFGGFRVLGLGTACNSRYLLLITGASFADVLLRGQPCISCFIL